MILPSCVWSERCPKSLFEFRLLSVNCYGTDPCVRCVPCVSSVCPGSPEHLTTALPSVNTSTRAGEVNQGIEFEVNYIIGYR